MKIGIVGLGLIGGSIGLKLQSLHHTTYGVTNNEINEKLAKKRKLTNIVSCNLDILNECELIILALPIKDLLNPRKKLIEAIPRKAIVTDVGSIKEPIIKTWENIHPLFVGSHPMAGSEKKGVNSGVEDLFKNKKWIITPTQKSDLYAINTLTRLISSMECDICTTSPKEHDEAVALVSHLPIFLASALIETANTKNNDSLLLLAKKFAASGYEDTTRVGGGNTELGLDLAINNQNNILSAIKEFKTKINEIESLIKNKKWDLVSEKLKEAKEIRNTFIN